MIGAVYILLSFHFSTHASFSNYPSTPVFLGQEFIYVSLYILSHISSPVPISFFFLSTFSISHLSQSAGGS
jgi:hypothetical protein